MDRYEWVRGGACNTLTVDDPRPLYQIVANDDVIEAIVTDALDGNYDVSASYEIFVSDGNWETVDNWLMSYGDMNPTISVDQTNFEISITDESDISQLSQYLDVRIAESTVGDFIVEYESMAGDDYHSTYVRGVEEIVITTQPEEYFYHLAGSDGDRQNSDVQGTFTDAYDYLGDGVGDLGDMYYVSTDQSLAGTTGVDGTVSGDIYYSGHHTDFDRNTSASSYGTAAALTGIINNNGVNVWNDDVTEFFTFYDNAAGGQFEIAVVYDTSKQAWRVNNEHFDTFQNVGVDETLAGELSQALGVDVEVGDYRVFYSAAFADIDAVLEENDEWILRTGHLTLSQAYLVQPFI